VQPPGHERLLLVDDEPEVIYFLMEALKQSGYHVTGVSDSLDAIRTFKDDPNAFDLVITDMTMPGLTGFELAGQMLTIRPELPIILCTGYNETVTAEKAKALGIRQFLLKPIDQDELATVIRSVLDS